jgi:hypothetical protein
LAASSRVSHRSLAGPFGGKPTMSLLHHIAATQAIGTGFTVTLLDGTSYKAAKGDFVFTDGLSIVHDSRRIYFPLTSIKSILIHNPSDK